MDLNSLVFKVESNELDEAYKKLEKLSGAVEDFGKVQKKQTTAAEAATAAEIDSLKVLKAKSEALEAESKAVLAGIKVEEKKEQQLKKTAKAQEEVTTKTKSQSKAIEEVESETEKTNKVLQRQRDILSFMTQGYSRGQAAIMATAKATGILSQESKELGTNLTVQRQLIGGDPFDKSISGLTTLRNKYQELQESVMQFNAQSGLTSKQAADLSRDKERLIIKMQIENKTTKEINAALQAHNSEYVKLANTLNNLESEQKDFERAQREAGNAVRAAVREEERMLSVLASLNTTQDNGVSINEKAARSIASYEQNLKRAGITGEQAAQKLALYKKQQLEVIAVEQKRQVQYLQRGLQPQIGDVVVSLAGGQNPLTVLLQQGDQIRGLIAQTGVEGEALRKAMQGALAGTVVSIKQTAGAMLSVLGGAIVTVGTSFKDVFIGSTKQAFESFKNFNSALTIKESLKEVADTTGTVVGQIGKIPAVSDQAKRSIEDLNKSLITVRNTGIFLLITGLIAAGVAMYQVMKQGTELSKALTLNGAQLGLNKDSAFAYASSLNQVGVSTTKAVSVIIEMAKAGNLSKDSIKSVVKAAVDLEKYGGVAIEETVKQFSKLKDKPVESLTELAVATGLINPAIIAQVKNLQDQGKAADASALAIKAYAESTAIAAASLRKDLTPIETAWKDITSAISGAWNSFKDFVTNSPALVEKIVGALKVLAAPFAMISLVLDKLDKTKPQAVKDQEKLFSTLGPSKASQTNVPTEEQTKLNADLAKAQEKFFAIQDKNPNKDMQRAKNILEIRETTLDYYRKLNPLLNENQVAEKASLEIQKLIANMDSKNAKAKVDNSKTFQSPKGNEAQNLEKQYGYAVDLAKKQYEAQRKIAKSNFEAGLTEKQEYITQDLSLLKEYEDKQLSMAESYEAANAKIYTETIQLAIKNRNAALASTAGSEDGVEKRKKIQEDYVQYLTNLGNNFESTQKKSEAAKEALKSFIDERSVQAITAYGKAAEENEKAFEKFTKTQEDYLANREIERKLQDEINSSSGHEIEALKAKAEAQKRYTTEISRTYEELKKSKEDLDAANRNPLATPNERDAAIKAYEKNMKISQKVLADSRQSVENAATDAIVEYYKDEFKRITSELEDAVVTFLFEGSRAGAKKLRESIIAELKKPVVMVVKAIVNTIAGTVTGGLLGKNETGLTAGPGGGNILSQLGSFFGGNSFGVALDQFGIKAGAYLGDALQSFAPELAGAVEGGLQGLFQGAGSFSNLAYGAAGIGGSFIGNTLFGGKGQSALGGSAGATLGLAVSGAGGAIAGSTIGATLGSALPVVGTILGAIGGSFIGSLFGGGTPYNTGGVYKANADGTGSRPEDRATLSGLIQNLGKAGFEDFSKRGSDTLDTATKGLAEGLLSAVNPVLKSFSKDALDSITVAFRANGKKATGNLAIDGALSNFKTSTNDPTKAFAEFTKYAASAITDTLRDADLPKWVQELLDKVPKDAGLEGLQAILTTIKQVQELTKIFNNLPMQNLKVITSEASIELIKLAGGLDALTSSISSYYDNFYSAEEKTKIQIQNLTRDFKALGIDILPKTRDAFVNLVNSQDLTTEAGRKMYLELLNLQGGLSAILPPLESAVNTLEDFKQKTDDAYSNLEKAVSIQKEYYSTLRDNAKSSVDRLKGIFDLLSTNIRELYNQVQQTSGMSASAGRNLISTAARTGVVPDQDELSVAIASVRDSLAEENYATRFEAERDALILAGQLTQIKKVTGNNLTLAERQLKAAEDQLTALEAILVNAKKQIDAARGIDTSVKSVTQALKDLTAAILGETSSTGSTPVTSDPNAPGGSNGFVIGGSSSGTSSTSTSLALGTKTADGKYTIEQPTAAGTFVVEARADQQKRIEQASALYKQLDGQVSVKTALETFKAQGYSLLELGAAGGFAYSDLLSVAAKEGVPRFATGGSFGGGLRLVGENGPELEHTGPSRIYSNNQTRNMLSDEGTKAEIQALRSDLRAQASATTAVMQEMLKINKRWDSDGLPEVRAVA